MNDKKHFNTKVVHGVSCSDSAYGAVMPPIYQTSTYAQTTPGGHKGYEYSRTHNPTRTALQESMATLESAGYGFVFSSGLAATDAILKLLSTGDEVIAVNDLYGGTYRIFTQVFSKWGIGFKFLDLKDVTALEDHISDSTKLIWLETPTNPMIDIIDIEGVVAIAKKKGCMVAVDNTFASPYLQQPLLLGADIVMHSATKYLGGHSDVIMGVAATNDSAIAEQLAFFQNASGGVPGPMDCYLIFRSLKTLHVRMQRHCENAAVIARFLDKHPKIDEVYWGGLEHHPNHHVAKRQMKNFGAMLSFRLKNKDLQSTVHVLEKLKVFTLAESLGGVESLACHPATMTHAGMPKQKREETGVVESLIRLSVGIEYVDDLVEDLKQSIEN